MSVVSGSLVLKLWPVLLSVVWKALVVLVQVLTVRRILVIVSCSLSVMCGRLEKLWLTVVSVCVSILALTRACVMLIGPASVSDAWKVVRSVVVLGRLLSVCLSRLTRCVVSCRFTVVMLTALSTDRRNPEMWLSLVSCRLVTWCRVLVL